MATLHADAILSLVVNRSSVKSPDHAISTKYNHPTFKTNKQPQTTTTNFTESLLKSSIKRPLSDKSSNQKATQVHPEVDNRQENEKVNIEILSPSKCDQNISLDKNEDELQASTKRTINPTRKGEKVSEINYHFYN